jgi:hypothetical protein
MTPDEIDIMWQQAMKESIKDGVIFTRYHFAELVAEKALAEHAMREVQRLGQEIEQEPPQRTWIGLEGAEFGWFCHTDFLNARKYTKEQRKKICNQLLSEAQSWDIGEYQLMMHDSTKRPQRTWVDLDVDDIDAVQVKVLKGGFGFELTNFARAIQTKLKEKNERLDLYKDAYAEQEPVMWPCLIDSADFSANTITLVMQRKDYKVSAGTHWLSPTPPQRTEQNFCSRCGKRTPDLITIHTCTPPKENT